MEKIGGQTPPHAHTKVPASNDECHITIIEHRRSVLEARAIGFLKYYIEDTQCLESQLCKWIRYMYWDIGLQDDPSIYSPGAYAVGVGVGAVPRPQISKKKSIFFTSFAKIKFFRRKNPLFAHVLLNETCFMYLLPTV